MMVRIRILHEGPCAKMHIGFRSSWDRDPGLPGPGGDLMILVVLITLRVTLRVAAAAVVSGVHRTLPAFEN